MRSRISVLMAAISLTCCLDGASAAEVSSKVVDCAKGDTINGALQQSKNDKSLDLRIKGTCEEFVIITRDDVTLRGFDVNSTLFGLVDVRDSSKVVIQDFTIRGSDKFPTGGDFGGINVLHGSSVVIANMRVENLKPRGIQIVDSFAVIRDTTVSGAFGGNYIIRGSSATLIGSIVGTNSRLVGMSLVNSSVTAKGTDLTFSGNLFGLLVQINSGLEHITGHLKITDNRLGIIVAGQGFLAVGSFIEIRNNQFYGIIVDELSSFSPLINAPGGGPSLIVADNPGFGVSVERGSTFEIFPPTTITGNGVGLNVEASIVNSASAKVHDNAGGDVVLRFGSRVTFIGDDNEFGSPVQCESTVITRGAIECGSTLNASSAAGSAAFTAELRKELADLAAGR